MTKAVPDITSGGSGTGPGPRVFNFGQPHVAICFDKVETEYCESRGGTMQLLLIFTFLGPFLKVFLQAETHPEEEVQGVSAR